MALPGVASIFTAEIQGIIQAVKVIRESKHTEYFIVSDSLSALIALGNTAPRNHLVQRLQIKICNVIALRKGISFLLVPGHSAIRGNDKADTIAKLAARRPLQFIAIPYTDWYQYMHETTYKIWPNNWQQITTQLRRIKPRPGEWKRKKAWSRRQVVMNRLRVGHTRLTQGYLLTEEFHRTVCRWCNNAYLTVEHLLVTCAELEEVRNEVMTPMIEEVTVAKLLEEGADSKVVIMFLERMEITGGI